MMESVRLPRKAGNRKGGNPTETRGRDEKVKLEMAAEGTSVHTEPHGEVGSRYF